MGARTRVLVGQEALTCVTCVLISIFFLIAILINKEQRWRVERQEQLLPTGTFKKLMAHERGFTGDKNAPYILFEFGDYECMPCHHAQSKVEALLKRCDGRIKISFFHLPLTQIHAFALPAACFAEEQRRVGGTASFWNAHHKLYSEDSSQLVSTSRARCSKLSKQVVDDDVKLAKELGIHGTPTFILCTPNREAYIIPLAEFPSFVEKVVQ